MSGGGKPLKLSKRYGTLSLALTLVVPTVTRAGGFRRRRDDRRSRRGEQTIDFGCRAQPAMPGDQTRSVALILSFPDAMTALSSSSLRGPYFCSFLP